MGLFVSPPQDCCIALRRDRACLTAGGTVPVWPIWSAAGAASSDLATSSGSSSPLPSWHRWSWGSWCWLLRGRLGGGYFEPPLWQQLMPWAGVAAYVVGIAWMIRIYRTDPEAGESPWRYRDF